ncbi:abnormal spindle-like microcephaly-associated protein homolog [Nephila pilipes]|uniref:Abnormal spindle-like microcephaly-associated protein homolog n=1 Tax=Nephila pilipes TaxID=299642 RepID=A0A8X6UM48_NEPPI|nr:abnormal spindle-like microcephaly-associated protein homolog [Nephila pilipes]
MEFYKKKRSPTFQPKYSQCFTIKAQCSPETKEEEKYVLELKPFAISPHIAFDRVKIGSSKTCILFFFNPLEIQQEVYVEKFPFEKGFDIAETKFCVPPLKEIGIEITWTPEKSVGYRETVLFKTSTGTRAQVIFHGTAYTPKKQKSRKGLIKKDIQKSPKSNKITTVDKSAIISTVYEEDVKENMNFISAKNKDFTLLSTPQFFPVQRKSIHPIELSDSPVRRQTYTINSMLRASQIGTDIKNIPIFPTVNQIKDESILKERSTKLDENHVKNFYPNTTAELNKGPNIRKVIQVEKNLEVFNDSLESSTLDLSPETDLEVNTDPVHSTAFTFSDTPWNDESCCKNIELTNGNELSSISCFNNGLSENIIQKRKLQSTGLEDLNNVKKSCSSVAFEVTDTIFSKPSEITLDLPHISSKQKQVTRFKHKNIANSKKQVKTHKLSKSISDSSDSNKGKNLSTSSLIQKKPSRFLPQRLNLKKSKVFDKIIHQNPYATFNSYYDEYWKEKQESAFTNWLNFILTPNDDFGSDDIKVNSAEIWVESMKDAAPLRAPSKEELSFKTYTAVKQLNQLRKAACNLYQSDQLSQVIKKIEKEVDLKKIIVRKDRALHADLGIKQDLLQMLLSYNPLWLRIGLETIYGEIIPLQTNNDIIGLSRFIIHRFLSNPDIVTKFAYSSVINYFKPGYEDCIKRFTLKKFILLVFFLDVAKRSHLIIHNPCLFCKSAKYKNSRSLLLTFSREYLSGEGDITKHLRYLGCTVQHEQTPLEEFDYAVRNIAVDLRCGLRLGKVIEILLQDWSISKILRANTLNRLAKIHNNEVILQALEKASCQIEDNIDPRDIVDGNREKTLSLLWQIIFKTQISKHVNLDVLKKENSYLRRSLQLKADVATFNALQNLSDGEDNFEMEILNSKLYKENEVIQQLFQWCQNVCAHYGVKVHNFTSSFSDGRALCFILHHYHPNLLPRKKIHKETSMHYFEKQMDAAEDEDCPFPPESRELTTELMDKLVKNEKENLELAFQKLQEIGQIPKMSFPNYVQNRLPDEKVVIILVSYINIRLMELSVEIRAARTILLAYRKWCLRRKREKLRIQIAAAVKIQRYWRSYLIQKRKQMEEIAAIKIQCFWKMCAAKKKLELLRYEKLLKNLNEKAAVIQAAYRKYRLRKYQQKHFKASVLLQSHARKWLQMKKYNVLRSSVIKIQQWWRAAVISRNIRLDFLLKRKLIVRLQSHIKRLIAQNKYKKQRQSAIVIQKNVRKIIARKKFLKLKTNVLFIENYWLNILLGREMRKKYIKNRLSIIKLQSMCKMLIAKRNYKNLKKAVSIIQRYRYGKKQRMIYLKWRNDIIKVQALFRMYKSKKEYCKQRKAIILIQSIWRGYSAKKKFLALKSSVINIQQFYRGYRLMCFQRHKFLVMKNGFTKLQAYFHGNKARKEFCNQRNATLKIQSVFRCYIAKKRFLVLKSSAIKIQKYYRGYKLMCSDKHKLSLMQTGFIRLQAQFRAYKARNKFCEQKRAVIIIQSAFRSYTSRKIYLTLKLCTIKIQQYYRGYRLMCSEKHKYLLQINGFIKLQAQYRSYKAIKEYCKQKLSAVLIQKTFKGYIAKKRFLTLKSSTMKIQKCYRGYQQMCSDRQQYLIQKEGFVKLQAQFRAYRKRKEFCMQRKAAITVQKIFRGYIAKKKYIILRSYVIKIQKYYRGYNLTCSEKKKYLTQKIGFIKLQAQFRAYKTQKEFCLQKKAAVSIQKKFRSYIAKKRFLALKDSAVKIQRYYRGYRLMCSEKQRYIVQKNSVIKLQALFRAYILKKKFLKQKRAAVVIQSAFRCCINKKKYFAIKSSTIKIQKYYRGYQLTCSERQKYFTQKTGFIKLQAQFRAYKARKEFCRQKEAAICLQSAFRTYICKKEFSTLKSSAIKIQKYYRGYRLTCSERQKYFTQKTGFIKLQAQFRAYKARKEFCRQKEAAICLQSAFRTYICKKKFLAFKLSAIKIQKYYQGFQLMCLEREKYLIQKNGFTKLQAQFRRCKGRREFCKQKEAAVTIQKTFRSYLAKKKFSVLKSSATKIQKYYRGYQLVCSEKQKYLVQKSGFLKLQAVYRGVKVRKNVKILQRSAVIIQSHCRKIIAMKRYKELKQKCIIIQQKYRAQQEMKKQVHEYQNIRKMVIIIQAAVRCYLKRKQYMTMKAATIQIQSYARMLKCRKDYANTRGRIIFIQRLYHCKYVLNKERKNCIKIQSYWRGYKARKEFKRKIKAIILIQQYFQQWKERQLQAESDVYRQWYLHLRVSTIRFQRQARIYLQRRTKSAIHIQSYVRMWLTRLKYKREKAAIKIQATWRAYKVRQSITDKAIIKYRENIKAATLDEYSCLKNRTRRALKVLLTDKNLRNILSALQNLEVCTRLSSVCCERLQQSEGLSVIIKLVRMCNRSVPHQEIIKFSTDILLNLAKYKKTVDSVWAEKDSLGTILNLMHIYRENGLPIFTKCCTLFWIFSQDPEKAEVLKNCAFTEQIQRFYMLSLKRKGLEEKRLHSKTVASANTMNSFMRYHSINTRESIPIEPDWVLGRSKRREFKDAFTAVLSLMVSLELIA